MDTTTRQPVTTAYIMYKGERVDVVVKSISNGMANVEALKGYPFLSSEVNSQGKTCGAWNCNGRRVRTDFVYVEVVDEYQPHPVDFTQQVEREIDKELRMVVSATPVKVTVSRSWAERHLNVDINGFTAELDKAFGKGNWTLA